MSVIHGGEVIPGAAERIRRVKVALSDGTGNAGMLAWQNPEDAAIIVVRLILDITTEATGSATADFGVAANGSSSSDTLIDGVDIGAAAGVFDNTVNGGTSGQGAIRVDANGGTNDFITGTGNSDPADLVGSAHIFYILADD